jgi:hypothetical protein
LRNRNGGNARKLSIEKVDAAINRGIGFFHILQEYNSASMLSFNPAREAVGRLSANFPMRWTVFCDPERGAFQISGSSPGPVTTPAYERQVHINGRLGGKVEVYCPPPSLGGHAIMSGFERFIAETPDMADKPYGVALAEPLRRAHSLARHLDRRRASEASRLASRAGAS